MKKETGVICIIVALLMVISELPLDKYKKIIKESLKNEAELVVMKVNKNEVFRNVLRNGDKI